MTGCSTSTYAHYLVVVFLHEAAERKTEALVRPHTPIHCINCPWRLVFVNFFAFTMQ